MAAAANKTNDSPQPKEAYPAFDQINGEHPWQLAMPEGCVNYPVRELKAGKIAYFNFDLAKEMGLVHENHSPVMNPDLAKKLVKTFSLRIINEFDQTNNKQFKPSLVKPHPYMATRYLQLQHRNKQGKTSGDGRGIWNGTFEHKNKIWDISSRGTGVTALAPGAVEAGKPLQSGSTDFGYGCGLAEIDELYSAAIMAEIIHRRGIHTERVLTIIDIGNGMGIGVRAAQNLFRPAHLFVYLKQENHDALQRATDFVIRRQAKNRKWPFGVLAENRYDLMLDQVCSDFATFCARLEREYIFAWLDWDGDNVLLDAGIIDYGSIRQFGLRHDKYRYDDVERWSTNLNEQKQKARLIVQEFAQLIEFLKTKKKTPLAEFSKHPILQRFDSLFKEKLIDYFLFQVGLTKSQIDRLQDQHKDLVDRLYRTFENLEKTKATSEEEAVEDGVNTPALYNMRKLLAQLPHILQSHPDGAPAEDLRNLMLAEEVENPKSLTKYQQRKIEDFQRTYLEMILSCAGNGSRKTLLKTLEQRASIINREDRLTGNALIYIVQHIMDARKKGLEHHSVQKIIEELIYHQDTAPTLHRLPTVEPDNLPSKKAQQIMAEILDMVEECKESI